MRKLLILSLLFAISCTKEVGKKTYELNLNFDSGAKKSIECLIYEKKKHYKIDNGSDIYIEDIDNYLYLTSVNNSTSDYLSLQLIKTEADYLACMNNVHLYVDNVNFASNSNVLLKGILELYGSYIKKGRKYIVDNGTFSIYWENAADYGEQPQLLTGTWTLRRK